VTFISEEIKSFDPFFFQCY